MNGNPGLVIDAIGPARFDVIGFDIVNAFPEVLSVAASDLPAGIDPTTPAGYQYIWDQNLWQWTEIDNLQLRGYRDGALVASASYFIPDTCAAGCAGITVPNADAPFSGQFTNLTGFEIAVVDGFQAATDYGILFRDGRWHTCLGPCGSLVVDNLALSVVSPTTPIPPQVPLPAALPLVVTAIGALLMLRLRRHRRA